MSTPIFLPDPTTRDFVFDGHAGASPSGAERWMACTASLGATRRFLETLTPNQQAEFAKGTSAARQGTTAHAAAEVEAGVVLGVIDHVEAERTLLELTLMPEVEGEAYDDEMAEYITEYVDLVKQYHDSGREVLIEERVSATVPLVSDESDTHTITGSVDCGVLPSVDEPELDVVDLKYGEGLDVDVESNPQIRIYGLGLLARLTDEDGNLTVPIERINYVIVQPRLGGIKTWSESLDDLLDWRDDVLSPALTAALTGEGAEFSPSDETCQWCPARGDCPALVQQRMDGAADLFDVITDAEFNDGPGAFPETTGLDADTLGKLLTQIRGLTKIAEDLKGEAERRLFRGEHVPGWQMVNYQPPRKWIEAAAEDLDPDVHHGQDSGLSPAEAEALWQKKLLSPTQALAVLKTMGIHEADEKIGHLIDKPPVRPVVAPEGDRRKTWAGTPPEQLFPDVPSDA